MKKVLFVLPVAALVAACGGGGASGPGSAAQLRIVGSSTVYPFTTAVAEEFARAGNPAPIVESTGTGSGIKLFCAGVGNQHPDMVNASRQMKLSEYRACEQGGVQGVLEIPVGIDGLTLITGNDAPQLNLTLEDIYKALAANPYGQGPNRAQTWRDVNPSLPPIRIRVLGPPPTSGTRDSLNELILEKGCAANPQMQALKEQDEDRYKEICTRIREDGAFVEAGENDNLLVQKVSADPGTVGVLGYSFLDENKDQVKPVSIGGVAPTAETISNLSYPGARKLYLYTKQQHVQAKPSIRDFLALYSRMWGPGGPLQQRGLVPLGQQELAAANQQAQALQPLNPAGLN